MMTPVYIKLILQSYAQVFREAFLKFHVHSQMWRRSRSLSAIRIMWLDRLYVFSPNFPDTSNMTGFTGFHLERSLQQGDNGKVKSLCSNS
ncbi:hypothetical protein F7734_04720 [Scytonema sp. UIC 10036]|uniref:hypothetical protein n=1 Tax=Scytonema sp. UIC 10036 TaxID=2304196 RepID=UPI0012DAB346|nr:hypothetical protein [Scytonema sp. UIC 10036]MUG91811.1 hypothetical protein [Scytonema sp. UIC 10036]